MTNKKLGDRQYLIEFPHPEASRSSGILRAYEDGARHISMRQFSRETVESRARDARVRESPRFWIWCLSHNLLVAANAATKRVLDRNPLGW